MSTGPSSPKRSRPDGWPAPQSQQFLGATGFPKQKASHRALGRISQLTLAMDSAYEMGHIRKLQAQHVRMQEKTFTNWINNIFQHGRVSAAGRALQATSTTLPAPWPVDLGGWLGGHLAEASRDPTHSTAEANAPSSRQLLWPVPPRVWDGADR